MTSALRDGHTFWGVTFNPGATNLTHARTLGSSPARTMQFVSAPVMANGARGRWYLKDRLNILTPAAHNALATVSPSNPLYVRPSNRNSTGRL